MEERDDGAGLGKEVEAAAVDHEAHPLDAKLLAQFAVALPEDQAQPEDPEFLGVKAVGQHPVEVVGAPLGPGPARLPGVELARVAQLHAEAGQDGDEEDQRHAPVQEDEQSGQTQ